MRKSKKVNNRYLSVCQGDVLLVNFGKNSSVCRNGGSRPCVVLSNDSSIDKGSKFFVVPLYRQPSKTACVEDILIRPIDCRGLRYDEYAGAINMVQVTKNRVSKKIGHIKNESVVKEILTAVWALVEGE
ncbi:MAG: type II toxin-antitoxin system PemK/MazF family toxin [Lachnospiraceae bacterium]|nr:type II toxin-antitoxin system PemK/MazF family toxin [Lachnospiraceae bacterium]